MCENGSAVMKESDYGFGSRSQKNGIWTENGNVKKANETETETETWNGNGNGNPTGKGSGKKVNLNVNANANGKRSALRRCLCCPLRPPLICCVIWMTRSVIYYH